jgi:membrane-associated phospholipid phosphatase
MRGDQALRRLIARRWELLGLFCGILLPFGIFGAIAEDVWEREGFAWDTPILWALHRHATPLLDTLMLRATDLGGPVPMAALAALFIASLLFRRHLGAAVYLALAVGGAAAFNFLAKAVFQRQRPALWPALVKETDYGLPSGHAMGSCAVIVALIILAWPSRWRWAALALGLPFVLLVGLSRIYLGIHYPSDIVAGWCAALLWVSGQHALRVLPLSRRYLPRWLTSWFERLTPARVH